MRSWDKQKKESYEQFEAFSVYRDNSDHRDLNLIAVAFSKSLKQVTNWYDKFNWKSRAEKFDTLLNNGNKNSFHKQLCSLGEKQAMQIIEVADSLDDLSKAIKDKLILQSEKVDEKNLEQLLKLISSYMKSMSDIQKIFQMLRTIPFNINEKEEKYPFEKIIQNDDEAFLLASKLLSRINEVRNKEVDS
jgi:hypothetical protein